MIALPILPDTIRIQLDDAGYAGVVAIARPLDNEELANWVDAFPTDDGRNAAAVSLVRKQLVTLEGVGMRNSDGSELPYDHAKHYRMVPTRMVSAIYAALLARAGLTGEQEKNSARPSEPAATPGSGS